MILILSTHGDLTTDDVIDWLDFNQLPFNRFNDNDLIENHLFTIHFSMDDFYVDQVPYPDQIKVGWFRKFGFFNNSKIIEELGDCFSNDLIIHLLFEYRTFLESLPIFYENMDWLTNPSAVQINKIKSLLLAKKAGLDIPCTLLTTDKKSVKKLIQENKDVITKPIREGKNIRFDGKMYTMFTELINEDNFSSLTDFFFPSVVQECLDKEYELRVFYLDGVCYSMAIFSQLDEQTKIDFRRYNWEKPNRCVPFQLPEKIESNIHEFMKTMELNTGSLDIVKTKDGRYVFLEVNPVGQFGMVSKPCNYFLEEKVANYLIKCHKNHNNEK